LAWLLPPLIFMAVIFKDSRTHAYTYMLPMFIVAGIGIDAFIGWIQRLLRGRSSQIAQAVVLTTFLMFSYISYARYIDHDPEYPWYPKHVLGMEFRGGYPNPTFGFPYSRRWRDIAGWFAALPDRDVILATNERLVIANFYLPSKVHFKYILSEPPRRIRAPNGLYVLVIRGPQTWMDQLWGLPLDAWREKLIPLHDFLNEEGEVVASVYFLTQEQFEAEFR
jgi:hypothetical protein